MTQERIVLVHGTGVRMAEYTKSFATAEATAKVAAINLPFVECLWGDAEGVIFEGRSLPDPPSRQVQERIATSEANWAHVLNDPMCELALLAAYPDAQKTNKGPPGSRTPGEAAWDKIAAYTPTSNLQALLKRAKVTDEMWRAAWGFITDQPEAKAAFRNSEGDIKDAGHTLTRAVVSQLNRSLIETTVAGLNRALRERIADRLAIDWELETLGIVGWFSKVCSSAVMRQVRKKRTDKSLDHGAQIGDILLYQSQGARIREFIREKVESCPGQVTLVAHSLGGIACVDMLAERRMPKVERLVTLGSQAPLLYELDALSSIRMNDGLPGHFPRWLNVYDRNDFLSFVAEPLLGGSGPSVTDHEAFSGLWPIAAHSAYFGDEDVWTRIAEFIAGQ